MRKYLLTIAGMVVVMSTASAQDKIRIAYLEPLSGPLAVTGDIGLRHLRYKAEHMNRQGGILGKKIEIIPFDNKGSPQESLVLLRQIADQKISYIAQGMGSHVAGALVSALENHNRRNPNKILYLNYAANDPVLTEDQCSFWHFRFDSHAGMKLEVIADHIASNPEIKKVFLINMDYAYGHYISKTTKRLLSQKNPNIEIVGDIFHPIGRVKDFSPYISQISASGADTVITGNWGNDITLLIRAAASASLKSKFYTFFGGALGVPSALGGDGEGCVFQVTEYHRNLPLEKNKLELYDFILPFDEKHAPHDWTIERAGIMLDMLKKAVEQAQSTEPTRVAFALEGMTMDIPYGEVTMRQLDHQLLQPLFISMFTKDVKYDAEGTGFGFKTVAEAAAEETATPTNCVMKRPERP